MIEIEEVDIFVYDVLDNKKFLFQVPAKIKNIDLKKKLESLFIMNNFEFRFKNKLYEDNEILSFEEGDTIYIYKKEEDNMNKYIKIKTPNKGLDTTKLTGILHLILVKYISDKIIDIKIISEERLRKCISDLKTKFDLNIDKNENIKIKIKEKIELNIINYSNYISSEIKEKEINNLISIFDEKIIKEIFFFWQTLTYYQQYQSFFEEELSKALKYSYFEYSISSIQLLFINDEMKYFKESQKCQNKIVKYLFHEIEINSQTELNNNNILEYSKKPHFGMGIYFTDKFDYLVFNKAKNNNFSNSFCCNVSQIYYNNNLKQNIIDFKYYTKELNHSPTYEEIIKNYSDKKVIKNGLYFARVKAETRQIIDEKDLIKEKFRGVFIGNEYIITEKEQILPLFNIEFQRNESLIIWRDPTINKNTKFSDYFRQSKLFIYENFKMNAYFESSIEHSLEIVKRKMFNKIIFISNIGLDLSGKRFIEISRKLLGFPVISLFFSNNLNHLNWIKEFPNVLITNRIDITNKYIKNYNNKGILELKKEIEKYFNIKLTFTNDFLLFPQYIDKNQYKNLKIQEINPNFKKVMIKNIKNSNLLCMDEKGNISFQQKTNNANYSFIWYITILNNQFTFFMNQYYLGFNLKDKTVTKEEYMKIWNFEKKNNYYIFYFENESNIITDNKNHAIIQNKNENYYNQLFSISEQNEDI